VTPVLLGSLSTVGVAGWCAGSASPVWRSLRGWVLVACCAPIVVWAAHHGVGAALDDPTLAGAVVLVAFFGPAFLVAVVLAVLAVLALLGLRRRPPAPAREDDEDGGGGGGGGVRRPAPAPPRSPGPAPVGPSAPWDQFDDLRSQWERVPAGTR
jgi:hypothetical protein